MDTQKAKIYDSGDNTWAATNISTIGHAVARTLHKLEETANKNVYISSVVTSQNEILAAFEKVSGKKWEIEKATTEQMIKTGQEKLSKGDYSGVMPLIVGAILSGDKYGSDYTKTYGTSNEVLGLEKENVKDTIAELWKNKTLPEGLQAAKAHLQQVI